jgi:hypothetical protein
MRYINPNLLPDSIIKIQSPKTRQELGVHTQEERIAKADVIAEKDIQVTCENWLTLQGFRRRSPEDIKRPGPCAGWFVHLHETKRNPILLDLLILFPDGQFVEVELKTKTGKPSPEQDALLNRGGKLCRSFEEFKTIIKEANA